MNRIRKLAEEILAKYPAMFSTDFDANKKALDNVAIIRNRALRNQIAGAIAAMVSDESAVPSGSISPDETLPEEQSPAVEAPDTEQASQKAT